MVCAQCSCVLVKQAVLAHGPRDAWAYDIVFVAGSVRVQELSLLRVPDPKHAQEHVLGARPQLGPEVLCLVTGAV